MAAYRSFVDRVLAMTCLAKLQPFEDRMMRTPVRYQREALRGPGRALLCIKD